MVASECGVVTGAASGNARKAGRRGGRHSCRLVRRDGQAGQQQQQYGTVARYGKSVVLVCTRFCPPTVRASEACRLGDA